jgi:hypothetical protein
MDMRGICEDSGWVGSVKGQDQREARSLPEAHHGKGDG